MCSLFTILWVVATGVSLKFQMISSCGLAVLLCLSFTGDVFHLLGTFQYVFKANIDFFNAVGVLLVVVLQFDMPGARFCVQRHIVNASGQVCIIYWHLQFLLEELYKSTESISLSSPSLYFQAKLKKEAGPYMINANLIIL